MFLFNNADTIVGLFRDVVATIGFPTIAALIWKMARVYSQSQDELRKLTSSQTETLQLAADVKRNVDIIQNNHLAHIEDVMSNVVEHQKKGFDLLTVQWDKSNEIFGEIKTSLAVIGDRLPRATVASRSRK
jgi:hypothetical protein